MKKAIVAFAVIASLVSCSKDKEENNVIVVPPSEGAVLKPSVGGPNQPNQVFLDLSSAETKAVNRASWDLAFSSGNDFRVAINGAVFMATKKIETTDITLPQVEDSNVTASGGGNAAANGFCDNPTGVLAGSGAGIGTAIAEISANDADNKVYLVNLGFNISSTTPTVGSVSMNGNSRGWKKIRILRNGTTGYKVQYADLNATTYTEKTITKDSNFNFTFFNFSSGSTVSVEPQKTKWDLCFTTFTNYVNFGTEVTYEFADFIVTNMKGGSKVYQVLTSEFTYDNFVKANIDENKFIPSTTDQRIIGSNWRNGGSQTSLPSIRTDRFYILKDVEGNYYKIKFLSLTNEAGERGNPTIQYAILK